MIVSRDDAEWLSKHVPGMIHFEQDREIRGEFEFCARFDAQVGQLEIFGSEGRRHEIGKQGFVADAYEIEVVLSDADRNRSGWPTVREVGGRCRAIARELNVGLIDLHMSADGSCCLGYRFTRDEQLTVKRFFRSLVTPFFFRISYARKFGHESARESLWSDLPHGVEGVKEYRNEMMRIGKLSRGSGKPCPCGSNRLYGECCRNEVQFAKRVKGNRAFARLSSNELKAL